MSSTDAPATKYVAEKEVGHGSFGTVWLARNTKTGERVAIKKMPRKSLVKGYARSEIINHSLLEHRHVIQFQEVFVSPNNIHIVMEFAAGGTLLSFMQKNGRLPEHQARYFFQQLILGVDYCHQMGVANRDIKLENILLQHVPGHSFPVLKLADFGYSKFSTFEDAKSRVGSWTYMAPEVLRASCACTYSPKTADVWSCGVVLYAMLVARLPFDMKTGLPGMLADMEARRYELPQPGAPSPTCARLLARLLEPDSSARITVDEIMQDPWFLEGLWEQDSTPASSASSGSSAGSGRRQSEAELHAIMAVAMNLPLDDISETSDATS